MNEIKVEIVPLETVVGTFPDASRTVTITNVVLSDIRIELTKFVSCTVLFFGDNQSLISATHWTSTLDEYNQWGLDDNYLIDTVLSHFNVQRKVEIND